MKHARISGYLLVITGLLHTLIGVVDGYPYLTAMTRSSLINTVTTLPSPLSGRLSSGFWLRASALYCQDFWRSVMNVRSRLPSAGDFLP